jgi:predicted histone-like DNA-binding protein
MTMHLKKIERVNPMNRSETRWYVAKAPAKSISLNEIAEEIEKRSTMSKADILGVLISLVELIPQHVRNGDSVSLGSFGTFRASINSNSVPTEEEVKATLVKRVSVNFLPGTDMKKALTNIQFKIV